MKKSSPLVLVTGASQGIGEAIALTFAREVPGVRLALVSRSAAKLKVVAKACLAAGASEAVVFACDVGDAAAVKSLGKRVAKRFGAVDVLVNNAGVFRGKPMLEMPVEEFDEILRVNLRSLFLVSKEFIPAMVAKGGGDVFNMSSIAGLQAYPGGAGYCAAKFGVTGLSKVMREELKATGVRVCCIHPGATFSPSWSGSGVPEERMMPASDVARAFLDVYRLSSRTVVEEIVLRPRLGDV